MSLGIAVMGGILDSTGLAVLFVPAVFTMRERARGQAGHPDQHEGKEPRMRGLREQGGERALAKAQFRGCGARVRRSHGTVSHNRARLPPAATLKAGPD